MNYNWQEKPSTKEPDLITYTLSFPYSDDSPCYTKLEASITRAPKYIGYTWGYLREQGLDPQAQTWKGEVGGTNLMAEYRSSGWDSFFRVYDDDFDYVFDEVVAYLDELMESGNVPQEWIDENVW